MKTLTPQTRARLLALTTLAFSVAPALAPSFRGYEAADFPQPILDLPVQPAPWAFALWSLIYLGLLAHAAVSLFQRAEDGAWNRIRLPLIASLFLGVSWLEIATRAPVLATVQILAMAGFALIALPRLPKRASPLLRQPVALYAGWLTAASGVACGVVATGYGLAAPETVALIILPLIALTALIVIRKTTPPLAYALGVSWALIGVIARNWGSSPAITALSAAAIALILALTALQARQR